MASLSFAVPPVKLSVSPSCGVVLVITGDGLKTLDAVRGSFQLHEIEPSLEAFDVALAPALA